MSGFSRLDGFIKKYACFFLRACYPKRFEDFIYQCFIFPVTKRH